MDLALHMGMTADGLERAMSERELGQWARLFSREGSPLQRVEAYLAQIALWIATTSGSKRRSGGAFELVDFFIGARGKAEDDVGGEDRETEEMSIEDLAAQFGATVFRKKD